MKKSNEFKKAKFKTLINKNKSKVEILKELNISERTYYYWRKELQYEVKAPPKLERAVEDIIKVKKEVFNYEKEKENYYNGVPINFKSDKPIAIIFMGDTHLDNPATDLELFEKHLDLAREQDDVFLVGLGDYLDNWVGYLAKLFAKQQISQEEAISLLKYYFKDTHYLACVLGNHDLWNNFELYFKEIMPNTIISNEMRLRLKFPSNEVTIRMRHTFKGKSQYNPAFPLVKQAIFNLPDDIICMGHTHQSGYQLYPLPDGRYSHCFVVGSYKRYDEYGKSLQTHDTNHSPAFLVIINPKLKKNYISVFYDIEDGMEYFKGLKLLTNKKD